MKKYTLLFAALVVISACKSGAGSGNSSYMPLAKGTTWSYDGTRKYTMSVGEDTTINGKKFFKMKEDTSTVMYAGWDNGALLVSSPIFNWGEFPMLKDGGKGTNWSINVPVMGMTLTSYDTIAEDGLTRTVNGKEYKDVIRVRDVQKADSTNPNPKPHDTYYAKGVGMIEDVRSGDTARLVATK